MLILTPEEIRNAEDTANKNGLSYEDMMESAGLGCAEFILGNFPEKKNIVILAGKGKNGGDGFVIARALKEAEKNVTVLLAFNSPSDELSEKNKQRISGTVNIYNANVFSHSVKSILQSADIIIDAVFGIGFKGSLPENISQTFDFIRTLQTTKIAIDIPSGLCTENEDYTHCFPADITLSMLCYKKEHVFRPYSDFCGETFVIPIGFSLIGNNSEALTKKEIKALLPERPYNANKGTFGKGLLFSGSYPMPGAAIVATKGCLNSGAGLTYLSFPDRIYNTVTSSLTECVFRPLSSSESGEFSENAFDEIKNELSSFSAVAAGPGITTGKGAENLIENLLKNYNGKLIIDADGINIISRNIDILKESKADILMTPHPAEMSRLTGISVSEINSNRTKIAEEFAKKYGVSILLKGVNTVICSPEGRKHINPTGSSALARGASGDLLTGIILGLAAQGLSVTDAAALGAYIHGLSGEIAEEKYSSYCATVERITDCIPEALLRILTGK